MMWAWSESHVREEAQMFNSGILDVAIGLLLAFLSLSLICSQINELIARAFAMRSNDLENGIRRMLNDPTGTGLVKRLYEHPLIVGLSPRRTGLTLSRFAGGGGKPSYIPAEIFGVALLDIIIPPGKPPADFVAVVRRGPANLEDADPEMKFVKQSIESLLRFANVGEGDLKGLRTSVESWFNETMDRVSGWYRRKLQLITLAVALVLSVVLNADALLYANSLWHDAALRASAIAAAQGAIREGVPAQTDTRQLERSFLQLQFPIGWSADESDPRRLPTDAQGWLTKVFGLLLTTIAISQGAPFWFDLLSKVTQLRATGSPESKERQDGARAELE
jgi:hypothetical protein